MPTGAPSAGLLRADLEDAKAAFIAEKNRIALQAEERAGDVELRLAALEAEQRELQAISAEVA